MHAHEALWAAVLVLVASAASAITVNKPIGSDPYRIFRPGDSLKISYTTSNPSPGSSTVNIDLYKADLTWVASVMASVTDNVDFDYTVPAGLTGVPGDFKILVWSAYESAQAYSSSFTIKTNPEQASYPYMNGTATVQIGATYSFAQLPLSAGGYFSTDVWRYDGAGLGFVYVSSPISFAVTDGLSTWTVPNSLAPGNQFVLMMYDPYTTAKWAWSGMFTAASVAPAIAVTKPLANQAFELSGRQLTVALSVTGGSIPTVMVDAFVFMAETRGAKHVHSFGTYGAGASISLTLPDMTTAGTFSCGRAFGLPMGEISGSYLEDKYRLFLLVRDASNPIIGAVSNSIGIAKFTTTWSFAAPAAPGVIYQNNPYTVLWNDIPSVAGCGLSGYLTARLFTYTPGLGYVHIGSPGTPPDFLYGVVNGGNASLTVPSTPGGVFATVPAVGSTIAIAVWDPSNIGTFAISPHMTLAGPSASAKRIEWMPGMPLVYKSPEGTTSTNAPMADPSSRAVGGFLFSGQSIDLRWRVYGPVDAIKIETMTFKGASTRCFVTDATPLAASVPAAPGFYRAVLPDGLIASGFTAWTLFLRLSDASDPSILLVSSLIDLYQPSYTSGALLEPTGTPPLALAVSTNVVFRWGPPGQTSGYVTFHFYAREPDCMAGSNYVRYSTHQTVTSGVTAAGSGYDRYTITVPNYACGTMGYFYINDGYSQGAATNGIRLLTPLLCFTGAGCAASACAAPAEPTCSAVPMGSYMKVEGGTLIVSNGGFVCIGNC